MNLVAIDIGNTNITFALFTEGQEQQTITAPGSDDTKIRNAIAELWQQIPIAKHSKEDKRDGAIVVSSVKPKWTEKIQQIAKEDFDENILIVGKDIDYPIDMSIDKDNKTKIGSDRILTAAAAFAVIEDAVVIADFGTAVTIDIVDERGIFLGGAIFPGFAAASLALHQATAMLPQVTVKKPKLPWGQNTEDAINCGLYYSALGALEEITKRYSEKIGKWPQVIITGSAAEIIREDCQFVDTYVPNLVVKGIALAYRNHIDTRD